MATEEAKYEIISKNNIYEVRKYLDRLAVETSKEGIDSNFRKLFNYISGRNDDQEKIAMTTPVTQVEKNGNITMQFYLPSKFNLAVLAPKVVPRGSRGVSRRLKGRHFGRVWVSLGIAWDPLGIIFGSF